MNKLDTYQNYANKCAEKLGIAHPVLRWSGATCQVKGLTHAHCHTRDGEFPRGTICLNRRWFGEASIKQWHHCIAHEVTHLAVKSPHHSPTFDKRMVVLGIANYSERLNARSTRKGHHHVWESWYVPSKGSFRKCRVCGKEDTNKGG